MLALVGQVHQALDIRVRVSDLAAWMNVSKQTARKHMEQWCEEGNLSKVKYKNRYEYQLSDEAFGNYLDGVYRADYAAYMRMQARSSYE